MIFRKALFIWLFFRPLQHLSDRFNIMQTAITSSDRIFRRFSLENILLFSLVAAVLRWVVLYEARSSQAILASQVLHALTYAAFHIAGLLYIDRLTPEGRLPNPT